MAGLDLDYVREAARRGIFAYIVDSTPEELQNAIEITPRFGEYQSLQGAFGCRALIEQAKGILMNRNAVDAVDADTAYALLRSHSQRSGQKLSDIAAAIINTHLVLVPRPRREDSVCPGRTEFQLRRARRIGRKWSQVRARGGRYIVLRTCLLSVEAANGAACSSVRFCECVVETAERSASVGACRRCALHVGVVRGVRV
jgi:ANTAR domain